MFSTLIKVLFPFLRILFFGRPEEREKYTESERRRAKLRFYITITFFLLDVFLLYRISTISISCVKIKKENERLLKVEQHAAIMRRDLKHEQEKVRMLETILTTNMVDNRVVLDKKDQDTVRYIIEKK